MHLVTITPLLLTLLSAHPAVSRLWKPFEGWTACSGIGNVMKPTQAMIGIGLINITNADILIYDSECTVTAQKDGVKEGSLISSPHHLQHPIGMKTYKPTFYGSGAYDGDGGEWKYCYAGKCLNTTLGKHVDPSCECRQQGSFWVDGDVYLDVCMCILTMPEGKGLVDGYLEKKHAKEAKTAVKTLYTQASSKPHKKTITKEVDPVPTKPADDDDDEVVVVTMTRKKPHSATATQTDEPKSTADADA